MNIKIKLLPGTSMPTYAKAGDAGFDLAAMAYRAWPDERRPIEPKGVELWPGMRLRIYTGLHIAIPEGYEGQVRPRSGLAADHGLVPVLGTVDAGSTGEVGVILINHGSDRVRIAPAQRIAQMAIAPVVRAAFSVVDELPATERGADGFGSTGTGVDPRRCGTCRHMTGGCLKWCSHPNRPKKTVKHVVESSVMPGWCPGWEAKP